MITAAATQRETNSAPELGTARPLAEDVGWVPLSIVNVYLLGSPGADGWVLLDAGLSISAPTIRRAAAERFGPAPPAAIVLTHGHFDHIGAIQELVEEWDVPVYAHPLELPYLTGRSDYPPPDPTVGGGMMAYLCRLYWRRAIDLGPRVRPLPEGGAVPLLPGWRWVHTPGHTPGHVSLFRDADRFLIAGDAFVTTKQESAVAALTGEPRGVRRPPAYFTTDWAAAGSSVRALAALRPEVAATGHGYPMRGERMRAELSRLAEHFGRAIPSVGRYVREPSRADETGVRSVPPPVAEPLAGAAAAVAAGAMIGWLSGRRP